MSDDDPAPASPPVRRIKLTMSSIERHEVIMRWLDLHEDDRDACAAMRTWVRAVLSGGAQVASGGFVRRDAPESPFHYAVVPGTGAIVVFYERRTVPVRTVVFSNVLDWPY